MADVASTNPQVGPAGRRPVLVWVKPMYTVLVWLLAVAIVLYFFGAFKLLVLGALAAGAMAAFLKPVVDRFPASRSVSAVVVGFGAILLAGGVVTGIGMLVAEPIRQEWQSWPQTRDQFDAYLQRWAGPLGLEKPPTTDQVIEHIASWAAGPDGKVVTGLAAVVVDLIIALAFVFIGSMYLLAEPSGRILGPATSLLPPRHRNPMKRALTELEPRMRWWVIGTMTSMSIVGVATAIGYSLVGLKFAIPLAMLAASAEIVPNIGPIIGASIAVLFAAVQGPGYVAGVLGVYAVIQILESYVILPMVMRKAVCIPPIVTLFTVVLWGNVFGAPGLLLAVPIDLLIWSIVDHLVLRRERA